MDGIAVRAADTVGAAETTPVLLGRRLRGRRHRRPAADRLRRRRHARARAPRRRRRAPSCAPPCRPTSTSARSARTSAPPSCCCPRATGCARSTSPRAPRPGAVELAVRRRPRVVIIPTGDEIRPVGTEPGARRDPRHQLADARRAGRARSAARPRTTAIVADDPDADRRRAARRPPIDADLVDPRSPGRAPAATTTPPAVVAGGRARWPCTASRCGPGTRSCSARWPASRRPRSSAPPATRSRPR